MSWVHFEYVELLCIIDKCSGRGHFMVFCKGGGTALMGRTLPG